MRARGSLYPLGDGYRRCLSSFSACRESFEFSAGLVGCPSGGYKGCGGMSRRIFGSTWMMRRDIILLLLLLEILDMIHLFERLLVERSHVAGGELEAVSCVVYGEACQSYGPDGDGMICSE
ncbi:hypothetical protein PSPO01_15442 [Paraphaeosphaeria sporulosa]